MPSSYRNSLNQFLSGLELECDTLIDVGGSQERLSHRVKSFQVKNYIVLDLPKPHANSPKPDIAWDMNDSIIEEAASYESDAGYELGYRFSVEENKADIITAFELFDYIWHAPNAMRNIAFMLKPGGTAIVSYPTIYPHHNPIEDDAMRYMEGGIRKLAKYAGLEVIEMIKRRPETDAIEQLWRRERLRAAKHYDHNLLGFIVKFRKANYEDSNS